MPYPPESDEVLGHQYRLAQANRLIRLARAEGLALDDVREGRVIPAGMDTICDENGKIVPEPEDLDAVR